MLTITEYTKNYPHLVEVKFIRLDWGTGSIEIRKDRWDKLSQRKKNLIYSRAEAMTDLRPKYMK